MLEAKERGWPPKMPSSSTPIGYARVSTLVLKLRFRLWRAGLLRHPSSDFLGATPRLKLPACSGEFLRQGLFRRQRGAVLSSEDLIAHPTQGVAGYVRLVGGAEDEPYGRIFVGVGPVLAGVVDVEVNLPEVAGGELAELEVTQDEAPQPTVKEHEINAVPLVADAEALLTADEGEVVAQFQQEALHVTDEGLFQLKLRVFILEIEEL